MNVFITPQRNIKFRTFLGTFLLCLLGGIPQSRAVFDPVNDDTDIFLANPNVPSQRPNVIIALDTSANWGPVFDIEKTALGTFAASLSDQYNVGLMQYAHTSSGQGNTNPNDGANLTFGVRQMTDTNKGVLGDIVDAFSNNPESQGGSKTNFAQTGLVMLETYRYFTGGNPYAGFGKKNGDITANSNNKTVSPSDLGNHPLPANASASSNYTSPIVDECQDNFLIYISNGVVNENSSLLAISQNELTSLGVDTSSVISLSPSGQQGNWMDEWAKYLAHADLNGSVTGEPHVNTYVVEVDPGNQPADQANTALMKSVANQGNGEYFAVDSSNNGEAIIDALNSIFTEIQAINSVFASTTLPVSVNVRGTNLNQVYIGVFRPDAVKSPRWFGNLKLYKLGFDSATNSLFLADATPPDINGDLNPAENPATGFINTSSPSFWTEDSTFWSFRTDEENGVGLNSDKPDGDLVEKGGAAQQARISYANDQSTRNLYTCTASCTCSSSLKGQALCLFDTGNTDISNSDLSIGTNLVSSLSAAETQSITELTDTRTVSALNTSPSGGAVVITLNNNATAGATRTITNLTNQKSFNITAIDDGLSSFSISGANRCAANGADKNYVCATTLDSGGNPVNHGFNTTDSYKITGFTDGDYNETSVQMTSASGSTLKWYAGVSLNNCNTTCSSAATISNLNTHITVTAPGHTLQVGDAINLSGINTAAYNGGEVVEEVNVNGNVNDFVFYTSTTLDPITTVDGDEKVSITSSTATASVTAHGYANQSYVTIAGTTPSDYSGTFKITYVDANTFTYSPGGIFGAPSVFGTASQDNDTTITATAAGGHPFGAGQTISISGALPDDTVNGGYNGSHVITSVSGNNFTFDTASSQPQPTNNASNNIQATSGETTTARLTATSHNFGVATDTVSIVVAGVTSVTGGVGDAGSYNGTFTATVEDANTLTYTTNDSVGGGDGADTPGPASGSITVRLNTNPVTAFATVPDHGYGDDPVTPTRGTTVTVSISGADNANYNQTDVTATVLDKDTFSYPLTNPMTASAQGTDTGTDIKAKIKTTTALARVVSHGFADGASVGISGANESAFNHTWTIKLPSQLIPADTTHSDADYFYFYLTENSEPAQADATGTIVAASGSGTTGERADLINWVRGEDNFEDENADGTTTDVRSTIHGDVLHSRPAVVNYNRHGNDDDVYIFYGANDGIFRAVKGGFTQSDGSEPEPGQEAWGFIPKEFFGDLQRMRNNEPTISSSNKKPYFADGTLGVYADDANGDGALDPAGASGDKVYLYISMRRGGRFLYALDATDPSDPKVLWEITNTTQGFTELGQTWSAPQVVEVAANANPILIFGAGYDPDVEDIDPSSIASINSSTGDVTDTGSNVFERKMGRGIFVVDAFTGAPLWQAGPGRVVSDTGTHPYVVVNDMDFAIQSDITVITDRNGTVDNRAYVGDTGGNVWRVDMSSADINDWTVTKLAAVSDFSSPSTSLRKFQFPPDVVYSEDGYDAVLIGSGDREHPFDSGVVNRFYMFKDDGTGTTAKIDETVDSITNGSNYDASATNDPTLGESALFDATSNCLQDLDACTGATEADRQAAQDSAQLDIENGDGWYITLGTGEKVIGNAVTLNNVTFFNTNQPSTVASTSGCTSDLGVARQYKVEFDDGTAPEDVNSDGSETAADRSVTHPGGGYLPSPVPLVVEIDGVTHEGVISGVAVDQPPGSLLNARLRKFWFKEIDE